MALITIDTKAMKNAIIDGVVEGFKQTKRQEARDKSDTVTINAESLALGNADKILGGAKGSAFFKKAFSKSKDFFTGITKFVQNMLKNINNQQKLQIKQTEGLITKTLGTLRDTIKNVFGLLKGYLMSTLGPITRDIVDVLSSTLGRIKQRFLGGSGEKMSAYEKKMYQLQTEQKGTLKSIYQVFKNDEKKKLRSRIGDVGKSFLPKIGIAAIGTAVLAGLIFGLVETFIGRLKIAIGVMTLNPAMIKSGLGKIIEPITGIFGEIGRVINIFWLKFKTGPVFTAIKALFSFKSNGLGGVFKVLGETFGTRMKALSLAMKDFGGNWFQNIMSLFNKGGAIYEFFSKIPYLGKFINRILQFKAFMFLSTLRIPFMLGRVFGPIASVITFIMDSFDFFDKIDKIIPEKGLLGGLASIGLAAIKFITDTVEFVLNVGSWLTGGGWGKFKFSTVDNILDVWSKFINSLVDVAMWLTDKINSLKTIFDIGGGGARADAAARAGATPEDFTGVAVEGFASGGFVTGTGLAKVHTGEAIIPSKNVPALFSSRKDNVIDILGQGVYEGMKEYDKKSSSVGGGGFFSSLFGSGGGGGGVSAGTGGGMASKAVGAIANTALSVMSGGALGGGASTGGGAPAAITNAIANATGLKVTIPGNTIASRNNNPGNLMFAGQAGAVPGEARGRGNWAKFETPEAGFGALKRQVDLDKGRGMTLSGFINKYAPASENNTAAYIAQMSKATGLGPNDPITNADTHALATGIARIESSTKVSTGDVTGGSGIMMPASGKIISGFGDMRDSGRRVHSGIDISGAYGSPVVSPVSGTISAVQPADVGKGGKYVYVTDQSGLQHRLHHFGSLAPGIAKGQQVEQGSQLGTMGNSGIQNKADVHADYKIFNTKTGQFEKPESIFGIGKGSQVALGQRSATEIERLAAQKTQITTQMQQEQIDKQGELVRATAANTGVLGEVNSGMQQASLFQMSSANNNDASSELPEYLPFLQTLYYNYNS